jgi:hypothetical protein
VLVRGEGFRRTLWQRGTRPAADLAGHCSRDRLERCASTFCGPMWSVEREGRRQHNPRPSSSFARPIRKDRRTVDEKAPCTPEQSALLFTISFRFPSPVHLSPLWPSFPCDDDWDERPPRFCRRAPRHQVRPPPFYPFSPVPKTERSKP